MQPLKKTLNNISVKEIIGVQTISIISIQTDSRKVKSGDAYVAIRGTKNDGHDYIKTALQQGAIAIVCEIKPLIVEVNTTYIIVENAAICAGEMLNNFYDNISNSIKIIGITGTNGKTSTATLLYQLFKAMKHKVGLISTVANYIHNKKVTATHTTPDVVSLYALINKMVIAKCDYVFMECSSHAIHQNRIAGLQFAAAIFINISHDHLDYHKTFPSYIAAKKMLFDSLSFKAYAISNIDDKRGAVMLQNTKAKKISYAIKTIANYKAKIISNQIDGLELQINEGVATHFKLVGEFNAYNLLAVYTTALCLGKDKIETLKILSMLKSPEGRFEIMTSKNKKICAIVDFAHTPDALENVLKTIVKTKLSIQKIFTVFGCGGNRDKLKRPIMTAIAAKYSHCIILTSDNPRNEAPQNIIKEMKAGIDNKSTIKTKTIINREDAICWALKQANSNDIVLVAGKGHEKYQEIKNIKNPFSDKKHIEEIFKSQTL